MKVSRLIFFLFTVFVFASCLPQFAFSQAGVVSMYPAEEYLHMDTVLRKKNFHTALRPYLQSDIPDYLSRFHDWTLLLESRSARFYLNKRWARLKAGNTFIDVRPVIAAEVGPIFTYIANYTKDRKVGFQDQQLGIELESNISPKLHARMAVRYGYWTAPEYLKSWVDSTHIVPQFGEYQSGDKYGYSAYDITGRISYAPTGYQNFQFGREKNFIGDGYRSLLLSDNAPPYWFFKSTTSLGRGRYQFMISQAKDINPVVDAQYDKKYIISHVFSYNLARWLNVYAFETIIQQATDSLGHRGLDVNYLNPVAFLRPIEFNIGSPDNALLGLGGSIRPFKRLYVYGQFLLDELIIAELTNNRGWWGNKYGIQLGAKTYEPFYLKGFLLQAELNMVRPYTYSHGPMAETYGNLHTPLAHPLGSNFVEALFYLRYQRQRAALSFLYSYSVQGLDTEGKNYGGDIYKDYETRTVPADKQIILPDWEGENDFGHELLQGFQVKVNYLEWRFSYVLNPAVRLVAEIGYRHRLATGTDYELNYHYGFFSIRSMLFRDRADY